MDNYVLNSQSRRTSYLLTTLLIVGLLATSFFQVGLAQEIENRIVVGPTEKFAELMQERPEIARERLEGGIYLSFEGKRPVRVQLFAALVKRGEISKQYLSERTVVIKPGQNMTLKAAGEEFIPGSEWFPGSKWIPSTNWTPNPEIFSEGSRLRYTEDNPFLNGALRESLLAYDKASPLLYLVAIPQEELDGIGDLPIGLVPLVIGGPETKVPGDSWVPRD